MKITKEKIHNTNYNRGDKYLEGDRKHLYIRNTLYFILCTLYSFSQNSGSKDVDSLLQQEHAVGFVENKGQIYDQEYCPNTAVLYLLNRQGMNIQLHKTGFSYDTYTVEKKETSSLFVSSEGREKFLGKTGVKDTSSLGEDRDGLTYQFHRIDIELSNVNSDVQLKAEAPFSDYFNYYNEVTPEGGATEVHHYKKVTYQNIYPNIDLVFSIEKGKPEYDFVVHPGGKVQDIVMQYKGMDDLRQTSLTELSLAVKHGIITDAIPMSYEQENNKQVAVSYQLKTNDEVSLLAGAYDKNNTLVIDPTPNRQWGTYYGGNGTYDYGYGIAVDAINNILITGITSTTGGAPNAFASSGSWQPSFAGGANFDAFVAKFNSSGVRQWGTYYGGVQNDIGQGIAIDASSNILITGFTSTSGSAPNAIASSGCWQTAYGGGGIGDAFVAKFNSSGVRQWGTYYGGSGIDNGYGIATDVSDNILITGITTTSGSVPNSIASSGCWQTSYGGGGVQDTYIAKFNSSGVRQWGTYYGGRGDEYGLGITTDTSDNILITGYTYTTGFAPNAIASVDCWQTAFAGGVNADAYVAQFNSNGVRLWGTYYGGSGTDYGNGIATDANNNILITGFTSTSGNAPNAIASAGCWQTTNGGIADAYVAQFNNSGVRLWGTYYGGSGTDAGYGIATDVGSNILITGYTKTGGSAPNAIATTNCWQTAFGGGTYDAFVTKFNSNGVRLWGTYYGGSGDEWVSVSAGIGIATDASDKILITGETNTTGFAPNAIASVGCWQTASGGGSPPYDAFIVKFDNPCNLTISPNFTICQGGSTSLTVSGAVSYVWTPSASLSSSTGNSVTANPTITTTYIVIDTISGSCTATVTIKVNSLPTLLISPNSAMCIGDVPLSIGAVGALTYSWHPSTGLSSTTGSPITASPPAGINSYTVTGIDANGCINDTSLTITVNGLPTLFTSPNTTICSGTVSTLSIGGSEAYTWSPSTGLNSTTGSAVQATLPSGTMTYTITGTNLLTGCSADTTITILVNPLPILSINPSVITICNGSSTSLSALGTAAAPPINYLWQPTTGLSSNTTATVTANPTVTSTYSVSGTDQNGCYNTATATVTVNTFLTITTTPANASICTGDNIAISASGATSYTWYPSTALNNNTGSTVTATPTSNISYTVTGTDNNGCTGEATSNITVFNLPIITISSDVTICQGNSAGLSANGANTYAWLPTTTPTNAQNVTATPGTTTNYTVTGTDQNNCSNTATVKVGVSSPTAVIASADVIITMGNTITISATADIGSSFIWSPSSTLSCDTCQASTASPTVTTTYYVTVKDYAGCGSMDSVIVTVKLNCADDVFVPDAFSPNGDGQNDVLYLKIQNGCIKTISFEIYDRWGMKVFESFDPNTGWDGKGGSTSLTTGSGKAYDPAVFVYYLQATLIDGNPISKKGNISLVK